VSTFRGFGLVGPRQSCVRNISSHKRGCRGLACLTFKRFLQTALAFKGHYNGLLDGSWGKISATALGKYSRIEFGTETENWHMATLALSFFNLVKRDGWDMRYIEPMGMSVLWLKAAFVTDPQSADFFNYRHSNSSLAISIGLLSQEIPAQTALFSPVLEYTNFIIAFPLQAIILDENLNKLFKVLTFLKLRLKLEMDFIDNRRKGILHNDLF
jgi:hypothetical protein